MEPLELFFDHFKPALDNKSADFILSTDEIADIIADVSGHKIEKESVYSQLLENGFKYVPVDEISTFRYKFLLKKID